MKILITGATGLIGRKLVKELKEKNHEVNILSRSKKNADCIFEWNLKKGYINEKAFHGIDGIIHLAGASIAEKWTLSYKKELYNSRIESAKLLHEYCQELGLKLQFYISASGINYYGTYTSDEILDENSPKKRDDFLANLSEDWEKSADAFEDIADRVVKVRTGMVLAKEGGALEKLRKTVDLNLSSAIGSGKQWMNWIHIQDLVNLYVFLVENNLKGVYNAVANDAKTNKEFMKTLSKVYQKVFLPIAVPKTVLQLALGEMSEILLEGTQISNEKIKKQGFEFEFNSLEKAVADLKD